MILSARGIRAEWEAASGHLPSLVVGGAEVLWAAPWRDDPAVQADPAIPVVDRRLGGTFACLPFGRDDVDGGPPHGATANAPWRILRAAPSSLRAVRRVPRGRVTAHIALRDDHPVLYQTHVLDLAAPCTFAHHPIFHLADGGRFSGDPRAVLTHDAEAPAFPPDARVDGWMLEGQDLRDYPRAPCEDFATLVARPGLGWTAVARRAEGDTILTLRRAEQLPVTNLWLSNGARGAHWAGTRGLVGIEDAICAGAEGFAAALAGNRLTAESVPTALPPGRHVIPHAIARLPGCHDARSVSPGAGHLVIETATGTRRLPFDETHLT